MQTILSAETDQNRPHAPSIKQQSQRAGRPNDRDRCKPAFGVSCPEFFVARFGQPPSYATEWVSMAAAPAMQEAFSLACRFFLQVGKATQGQCLGSFWPPVDLHTGLTAAPFRPSAGLLATNTPSTAGPAAGSLGLYRADPQDRTTVSPAAPSPGLPAGTSCGTRCSCAAHPS